jgi:hypothetical protein
MLDRAVQETLFDISVTDRDTETPMERRRRHNRERQFTRRQRRAFLAPIIETYDAGVSASSRRDTADHLRFPWTALPLVVFTFLPFCSVLHYEVPLRAAFRCGRRRVPCV